MSYKFARGDLAPAIKIAFQHGGCASIQDMQLTAWPSETFYPANLPTLGLDCQGERNHSCTDHGLTSERKPLGSSAPGNLVHSPRTLYTVTYAMFRLSHPIRAVLQVPVMNFLWRTTVSITNSAESSLTKKVAK